MLIYIAIIQWILHWLDATDCLYTPVVSELISVSSNVFEVIMSPTIDFKGLIELEKICKG